MLVDETTAAKAHEILQGTVEHITFHNEENGFCVLRAKVKGHADFVTIIGTSARIGAGEYIQCHGSFFNSQKHGVQFQATHIKTMPPTSLEGIEKFLASGIVKGIGAHYAKILVGTFGEAVFDIIEKTPERLLKISGIGKKRLKLILSAWSEQKSVRAIMVFLQSHNVGTARAARIYKTYGDHAIDIVRENPYRLAIDIYGIGFKTADALAGSLGIAKDSLIRAQAGVHHVLHTLCDQGHCAIEQTQLITTSCELLDIPQTTIELAIQNEITEKNLISDEIETQTCIYPASLYHAEVAAATHLAALESDKLPWKQIDCEKAIAWVEKQTKLVLSESQKTAIQVVLNKKISIITGGPGVGKTTLVNSILKIINAKKLSIALCAPTGRAAKRLSETTGIPAKTIHRLLAYDPRTRAFKHDHNNTLPIDILVVDETSMLDIVLFHHLLKAIPKRAAVIFVGDIDQLPSVGPGAVLADLIRAKTIATIQLTEIFRQAADSNIIINSHRINRGEMPLAATTIETDFYMLYADEPEMIHEKLLQLVTQRIPNRFKCNPITDIQVLTPMNRGGLGSQSLNIDLQQQLNGNAEPKVTRFGRTFAPGDKVIQTINNYDKDIYNGDIGFIQWINLKDQVMNIQFDTREIDYGFDELDEVSLAYAISIHKSQGSEFPIVVLPITIQHYPMLARNLLYTGVSRGKKLVILLAQKKAVAIAVNNNKTTKRITKLAARMIKAAIS